jgi:hypothetical protein
VAYQRESSPTNAYAVRTPFSDRISKYCVHLDSCLRFEVFPAVTNKNSVSLDIKTQFVPHRRHITPLLQSPADRGDYEECLPLGYKSSVRTSQEAHFVCCRDQPVNAM